MILLNDNKCQLPHKATHVTCLDEAEDVDCAQGKNELRSPLRYALKQRPPEAGRTVGHVKQSSEAGLPSTFFSLP